MQQQSSHKLCSDIVEGQQHGTCKCQAIALSLLLALPLFPPPFSTVNKQQVAPPQLHRLQCSAAVANYDKLQRKKTGEDSTKRTSAQAKNMLYNMKEKTLRFT